MKKTIISFLTGAALLTGCASDPDVLGDYMASLSGDTTVDTQTELATYGLAVDTTSYAEDETIDASDEDYIENNSFTKTVNIVYDGTSATVTGSVSGVTVTTNGADVTVNSTVKKVAYHVSGSTTDGCLKIYSNYKFALNLDGVTIHNSDGAAINIQSKKRGFIVLKEGTVNTLTDGTAYTDTVAKEDMKATFFSEGKMLFSGKGKLRIQGSAKAALRTDKYLLFRPGVNVYAQSSAGNAIKTNDGILVRGGAINAVSTAANARAMTSEGVILISGGRTILIASGTNENGKSDGAALKADTTMTVTGGILSCQSTYSNAIHAKEKLTVSGGSILAYGAGATAYGISCDSIPMQLNGGVVAAIGGKNSAPSSSSTSAFAAFTATGSVSAATPLSLCDASGNSVVSLRAPRSYTGYSLLFASPNLTNGSAYTLQNATSTLATVTSLSTSVTSIAE